MALSITVPKEYGWVLLSASGTFILSYWLSIRASSFRKAAKVPLPTQMVAPRTKPTKTDPGMTQEEYLFNCAQRAHGNFLENYPSMLTAMLVMGVQYPLTSAISGAVWIVGRTIYAMGYTNPGLGAYGKGRYRGFIHYVPPFVLYGLATYSGFKMVMS